MPQQRRETSGAIAGWPLQWAVLRAIDVQLETETQVRKLEEELGFKKDIQLSTILLVSRMANKLGVQHNKLEHLRCHFAKLGGHKLLRIKVKGLVAKADWDTKKWNPGEREKKEEEEDVVVIDSDMDKGPPCRLTPNTKQSKNTAVTTPASRADPNAGNVHDERIHTR